MDENRTPDSPADDERPAVDADSTAPDSTVPDSTEPHSTALDAAGAEEAALTDPVTAVLVEEGGPGGGGGWGGPPDGDTAGDGSHEPAPGDDTTAGIGGRRLRRDMAHRMLGGVAAGTARYLDIDVVIVRVAFAVLAFFGGSGVLLYAAAWLLVPADDDEEPIAAQWAGRRPRRRSLIVILVGTVIGIVALSDLFSSGPWWPHRDGGVGLVLGAIALVLALGLVAGSGGNRAVGRRLRWLVVTLVLAVLAVVVVAAATVFSIEAASGVPLRGGIGDTQFQPTSAAQLQHTYRLAMGNLTVDLSDVTFRPGTTHVTASVGVGRVVVDVPPGPVVSVVAHSGLGDVQVFGRNNGGLSTVQTMQSAATGSAGARRHVVLDVDAGVGQVQVLRTPAASLS